MSSSYREKDRAAAGGRTLKAFGEAHEDWGGGRADGDGYRGTISRGIAGARRLSGVMSRGSGTHEERIALLRQSWQPLFQEIVAMTLRPVADPAREVTLFLIERSCLKIKGRQDHEAAAFLCQNALHVPHQGGSQPLSAISFIHPQGIHNCCAPITEPDDAPAEDGPVPVRDLPDDLFLLGLRFGGRRGVITVFAPFQNIFDVFLLAGLHFIDKIVAGIFKKKFDPCILWNGKSNP